MSSILPCTCLPPPPPPPPHCPVCRPSVPAVPNACSQSLTGPRSAWHMGRSEWTNTLPVCVPKSPQQEEFHNWLYPSSMVHLVLSVKVTAKWKKEKKGPFAAFRLLDVAAWLQRSAEIPPLSCSLDNACRPRLSASLCLPLYTYI